MKTYLNNLEIESCCNENPTITMDVSICLNPGEAEQIWLRCGGGNTNMISAFIMSAIRNGILDRLSTDYTKAFGYKIMTETVHRMMPDPEKIIFNDPATIVYWKDGTKTVVKCQKGDTYNSLYGLAMCYMKKALGNKGNYFNKVKNYIRDAQHFELYEKKPSEENPEKEFDLKGIFDYLPFVSTIVSDSSTTPDNGDEA